jgi:addiction module HigA family antidote
MRQNAAKTAALLIPVRCFAMKLYRPPVVRRRKIARLLGISRQHLYDILQERKPVSPAIAVRLGKLFGDGAGIWTRMHAAYDTWHAERTEDVSHIPTIKAKAA